MHILCTICSDIVNQSESIYGTKCGHLFHHHCLSQWIERSKTCPQCRNKVTDKCMFRMYPTAPENVGAEDAATLQSRLDDAMLQLRQHKAAKQEDEEKLKTVKAALTKNEEILKASEKKLVTRESAIAALKEQLDYVKIQNRDTNRLREENESLQKSLQTLHGLQKVLNATTKEVEEMLGGYSDIKMVATFATALKKALCEAESKKRESRERLQSLRTQIASEKNNVAKLEAKVRELEERVRESSNKRKSCDCRDTSSATGQESRDFIEDTPPPQAKLRKEEITGTRPGVNDVSVGTLVRMIEQSESPYLQLRRGAAALPALAGDKAKEVLLHPTQLASQNKVKVGGAGVGGASVGGAGGAGGNKFSIFHQKVVADPLQYLDTTLSRDSDADISYDGLGGHSRPDVFPAGRGRPPPPPLRRPKLTAKHRLKRPDGVRTIADMIKHK